MARLMMENSPSRERLIAGAYQSRADDGTGLVAQAFDAILKAAPAEMAVRNALKVVPSPVNVDEVVTKAVSAGVITEEQGTDLKRAQELTAKVIAVDEFKPEELGGQQAMQPPVAKAS